MCRSIQRVFCLIHAFLFSFAGSLQASERIEESACLAETLRPLLCFWSTKSIANFGDELSEKIVSRLAGYNVETTSSHSAGKTTGRKKLLAVGSILSMAEEGDLIWGTGVKEGFEAYNPKRYRFTQLDVRAVRGPLTRAFLLAMGIPCPEIYGDPALLVPRLFPEFKKPEFPSKPYSIVVHFADTAHFRGMENVISAKEDWRVVIEKILDSQFIISTSLHGIIVAEAFGIPARYLRVSEKEKMFKFHDYYLGTGRPKFTSAKSVAEALRLGGETPPVFDADALYDAFPFEYYQE